ncbi:MAG: hypothetical protein IT427_08515 [Pirellulales bacterium]|nr:hypothetical protein [Pirellulales bacterium]
MNCDEVFAILTRGPFPAGDRDDQAVEMHLRGCADCQRLAEALRPNDEDRPEAVAPEDTMSLPGYWGAPLYAELRPILSLKQPVGQPRPQSMCPPPKKSALSGRHLNLLHFSAAIVLGIFVAAILRTLVGTPDRPLSPMRGDSAGAFADRNHRETPASEFGDEHGHAQDSAQCLRGLVAPAGLSPPAAARSSLPDLLRRDRQNCCNRCHHTGGVDGLDARYTSELRANCAACHHWVRR